MEKNGAEKIKNFDSKFTNNYLCMLKIIYAFAPSDYNFLLASYIKILEVKLTLSCERPAFTYSCLDFKLSTILNNREEITALLRELIPYSGPNETRFITTIIDLLENYSQILQSFELFNQMKELFPDGISPDMFNLWKET